MKKIRRDHYLILPGNKKRN